MHESTLPIDVSCCPFCKNEMQRGTIYAAETVAPYWLPYDKTPYDLRAILTAKGIAKAGGFVIGETYRIGLISKNPPDSFYCKTCDLLLTPNAAGKIK